MMNKNQKAFKERAKSFITNIDFWLLLIFIIIIIVGLYLLIQYQSNAIIVNISYGLFSSGIVSFFIELLHIIDNVKTTNTIKKNYYSKLKYFVADFFVFFVIYVNDSYSNTNELLNKAIEHCESLVNKVNDCNNKEKKKIIQDIKFICSRPSFYYFLSPYINEPIVENYKLFKNSKTYDILRITAYELNQITNNNKATNIINSFRRVLINIKTLIINDKNLEFFNNLSFENNGKYFKIDILNKESINDKNLNYLEYITKLKFPSREL